MGDCLTHSPARNVKLQKFLFTNTDADPWGFNVKWGNFVELRRETLSLFVLFLPFGASVFLSTQTQRLKHGMEKTPTEALPDCLKSQWLFIDSAFSNQGYRCGKLVRCTQSSCAENAKFLNWKTLSTNSGSDGDLPHTPWINDEQRRELSLQLKCFSIIQKWIPSGKFSLISLHVTESFYPDILNRKQQYKAREVFEIWEVLATRGWMNIGSFLMKFISMTCENHFVSRVMSS